MDEPLSREEVLARIVTEALLSNEPWASVGCTIDQLAEALQDPMGAAPLKLNQDFDLKDLELIPFLSYDPQTRFLRPKSKKKKAEKRKSVDEEKPAKKKKVAVVSQLPVAGVSTKAKEVETAITDEFISKHVIGEQFAYRANQVIASLKQYLETCLAGTNLKSSVHPVGSFAAGLGSKSDSTVDLAVRIDGGMQTNQMSPGQVVEVLLTVLENCPFFATVTRQGELIECVVDYSLVFTLHAFNAVTFPMHWLHHARMFSSFAKSNPVFILLNSHVKSWARENKLLEKGAFSLGQFGWTILVAAFLISNRLAVSPFAKEGPPEQFGPRVSQSYSFVRSFVAPSESPPLQLHSVTKGFFLWLACQDLTMNTIGLQGVQLALYPGWITILDPIGGMPIHMATAHHSEVITYALAVSDLAREALKVLN